MKKLLLCISICIFLFSCKKNDAEDVLQPSVANNNGTILDSISSLYITYSNSFSVPPDTLKASEKYYYDSRNRIAEIRYTNDNTYNSIVTFYYNGNNNFPIKATIIVNDLSGAYTENHYFTYDFNNRLLKDSLKSDNNYINSVSNFNYSIQNKITKIRNYENSYKSYDTINIADENIMTWNNYSTNIGVDFSSYNYN
jgi:hypothetical protein